MRGRTLQLRFRPGTKPAKVRACKPNVDSTDNNSKSRLGRHSGMNDGWSVVREGSPNRRKVVMIVSCLYCTPGSLLLEEGDEDEDDDEEEMRTKSDIGLIEASEWCVCREREREYRVRHFLTDKCQTGLKNIGTPYHATPHTTRHTKISTQVHKYTDKGRSDSRRRLSISYVDVDVDVNASVSGEDRSD